MGSEKLIAWVGLAWDDYGNRDQQENSTKKTEEGDDRPKKLFKASKVTGRYVRRGGSVLFYVGKDEGVEENNFLFPFSLYHSSSSWDLHYSPLVFFLLSSVLNRLLLCCPPPPALLPLLDNFCVAFSCSPPVFLPPILSSPNSFASCSLPFHGWLRDTLKRPWPNYTAVTHLCLQTVYINATCGGSHWG